MRRQIEKVVAAQLLEAVKEVLDHLSRWQISLNQEGKRAPARVAQCYGRARRLRDYLQRCVAAYPSPVELELGDEDADLLAACAVHSLGMLDQQLGEEDRGGSRERIWAEEKRRSLAHWAVELATQPIDRIPHGDPLAMTTHTVRSVVGAVQTKVTPPLEETNLGFLGNLQTLGESEPERPQVSRSALGDVDAAEDPGSVRGARQPPAAEEPPFLDPRRMRDPRLRGMVVLDQRAFKRARAAQDHRLAMVHLASVVEAAVLDHVLPRIRELGLRGTPESWKTEDLLVKVLGDRLSALDRAFVLHLVAARNLVRPAVQLGAPMVVTAASLQQGESFAHRVLAELGYTGDQSRRSEASAPESGGRKHFEDLARQLAGPKSAPETPSPLLQARIRPRLTDRS